MGSRSRAEHSDSERVRRWRRALLDDLGPDLRRCIRWMHDADPEGLIIVLRSMRRCAVPELLQQATSIYWQVLTFVKRGKPVDLVEQLWSELHAETQS